MLRLLNSFLISTDKNISSLGENFDGVTEIL